MLIQQLRTVRFAKLVGYPFGLGATKSRSVGFSLPRSFLAPLLFSYSVQVDHVPHAHPIIQRSEGANACWRNRRSQIARKQSTCPSEVPI
jgi:hypothetical protein